jgi:hypothetical protein
MISLRAKNKRKAPATTTGKGKRKLTVTELDNDDEEGENDDDEDAEAGEKKALADLDAVYCACVHCGPTVLCKIDRSGNHIHLSLPQRHAWAVRLSFDSGLRNEGGDENNPARCRHPI